MVRGSPRLLAYQPVIYVKILAKKERERARESAQGRGKRGGGKERKKNQQRESVQAGHQCEDLTE